MNPLERACFEQLLTQAPPGPRIELGVFRGATLRLIANHPGATYGVDSFKGMSAPTAHDIKDGWNPYPKGRLAAPMTAIPGATLIQGWVPAVLEHCPAGPYAFAHIDLDQYAPTAAALAWLWTRMAPGGILCCDDWFADRDWLAAGAINAWAAMTRPLDGTVGRKAWWVAP